jgi:hypothetical protein
VGIEQVHRCTEEDRTVERSVEKILCQEGIEKCADRHRREENSLSSGAEGRIH